MKMQTLVKTAAFAVAVITSARSEITVDKVSFWNNQQSPIVGTFDASGSDKLVLVLTGEHGFNNDQGKVLTAAYDGVDLVQGLVRAPVAPTTDTTYQEIWYLDNPSTSTGEIVVTAQTRANVTAFAISGAQEGIGAIAIGDPNSTSAEITTTASGSLVIASYGMGGFNNNALINDADPNAPFVEVSAQRNNNRNWDGHVVSQAIIPTAGPLTVSYTNDNPVSVEGAHVVAAEFIAADGVVGGGGLVISDISFSPVTNEVTLTWPKTGASSYTVRLSPDLLDWNNDLDDGVTEASDEDPEDADNITVTLPVPANFEGVSALFFRVETGV